MDRLTHGQSDYPQRPDLRQSLSHTLLAAAFVLLGILNPFAGNDAETRFHWWMMVVLAVTVALSWYFAITRWLNWRSLPANIKTAQAQMARYDRGRAKNHALMSALALLLTVFAFLGHATMPEITRSLLDEILFCIASAVAVVSTAVFSASIRDILAQHKHGRNE
ncbi:MAG: hypothetical protein GY847_26850 [Proteobacteria bacterium]|nr:hypothetical protein [Pseudomonadota bacterium]